MNLYIFINIQYAADCLIEIDKKLINLNDDTEIDTYIRNNRHI
jgi:hypothetical protein